MRLFPSVEAVMFPLHKINLLFASDCYEAVADGHECLVSGGPVVAYLTPRLTREHMVGKVCVRLHSSMRRVLHEGLTPRTLQEKAPAVIKASASTGKACAKMPCSRYLRNAWRTSDFGVCWSPCRRITGIGQKKKNS